jgi:hypothetical protein
MAVMLALCSFLTMEACHMGLAGVLGVKWEEDPGRAASQLGLSCQTWEEWSGKRGFQVCHGDGTIEAYGQRARISLVQKNGHLAGAFLSFVEADTNVQSVRDAAVRQFDLQGKVGEELAFRHIFRDESQVHFEVAADRRSCTLTLADPDFSRAYSERLREQGFSDFVTDFK